MLHGNLLLSGWWLADVSFYTFEVPVYALVEWVRGLNPDVVHTSAALIYTLLVLCAAMTARGNARGAEGVTRALLGAGILVAPTFSSSSRILLLSPDHIGIAVPILLTLLLVDRAGERAWVPAAMFPLLIWAQLDDPLATYAAAAPIALVCLVRACAGLVRWRRSERSGRSDRPERSARPAWYDACLAVAAMASVALTHLITAAIRASGGYSMQPLTGLVARIPFSEWGSQIHATGMNVLILFGADFFYQPAGIRMAIAFVHFAGVVLAACGLLAGLAGLVRGADRVTQTLTVSISATLVAGTFASRTTPFSGAHEIAVVLPFGAVLAGRTLGPWLVAARRRRRIMLAPALGVALAGYLAALGYATTLPAQAASTQGLADWLAAHHLTSGLGKYWLANSTTLASSARVQVSPVQWSERIIAYPWVAKPRWYDPGQSYANFVVAAPGNSGTANAFPDGAVRQVFGDPARVYRYGAYEIMVWDKNLLLEMLPPDQHLVH